MILGTNLSKLIFGEPKTEQTKTASHEFDVASIYSGLEKVADFEYNPETYASLRGMLKIASQCMKALEQESKTLQNSVSEFEKKAEVRIILDDMIENGLTDEFEIEDKVESLLSKSASELETVKEAVKLSYSSNVASLFDDVDKTASIETSNKRELFAGII